MILVIGGTGFIGRALVNRLVMEGHDVRLFVRPSQKHSALVKGVPIEISIGDITDPDSLTSALVDVDTVFHLAGVKWKGVSEELHDVEVEGSRNLAQGLQTSRVEHVYYLSHLGADRASAYPVLKAKGIAEENIRNSGVDYTILRSSLVYGPGDEFTNVIAKLLMGIPFFYALPSEGEVSLQPIWIEDLVTCLVWGLDNQHIKNQTIEIGGPEQLSLKEIVEMIKARIRTRKLYLNVQPSLLRITGTVIETFFPGIPVSVYWVDYLAMPKTCALDSIPYHFGLMPARMKDHLEYLEKQPWERLFWRDFFRRS